MNEGITQKLNKLKHRIKKRLVNDKNIYVIYTMSKVGSSTVYQSLKSKRPFSDIFHVHFLSENYLDNILPQLHENFHSNIPIGREILSFIAKNPNSRIKIVTLTRDPIDREISGLFQSWKHLYSDIEQVPHEELKEHIESKDYDYSLGWFDEEFKEYLHFDIYEHDFDREKGYEIYSHGKYDILCIKLEKLNAVAQSAFLDFFGEQISLVHSNSSKDKKGKDAYKYLKQNVEFDKEQLEKIYNSKYVKHFYSENEINAFKSKWSKS